LQSTYLFKIDRDEGQTSITKKHMGTNEWNYSTKKTTNRI